MRRLEQMSNKEIGQMSSKEIRANEELRRLAQMMNEEIGADEDWGDGVVWNEEN